MATFIKFPNSTRAEKYDDAVKQRKQVVAKIQDRISLLNGLKQIHAPDSVVHAEERYIISLCQKRDKLTKQIQKENDVAKKLLMGILFGH